MKYLAKITIQKELKIFLLLSILSLLLFSLQSCSENDEPATCETDASLCIFDFDYQTFHSMAEVAITTTKYYDDNSKDLEVKIFEAESNNDNFRPLLLLSPGGAWTRYTRLDDINAIALNLAKRGYVVGVVEYTINEGGSSWNPYIMVQSILDIKAAVKFFKKNAVSYRIDTEKIFSGGWSSGGQASLYSAHLSEEDFEVAVIDFKNVVEAPFAAYGFEPNIYEEYSSDVKGTILLMPWSADPGLFDLEGPSVMMIAHPNSHFAGGERIWGEFLLGGSLLYGPDKMREHALSAGYIEGENLQLHVMDDYDMHDSHVNYSPLMDQHYDRITDFIFNNLN
ncbi:MAG: hypothetical protein JXR07_16440 [Reichenbachiella sp.]